jgi:hypothetical protein
MMGRTLGSTQGTFMSSGSGWTANRGRRVRGQRRVRRVLQVVGMTADRRIDGVARWPAEALRIRQLDIHSSKLHRPAKVLGGAVVNELGLLNATAG